MAVDDLTTLKTISIKSKKKVLPRYILSDNESEVFCIRFSPDDTYLAGLLLIKLNYASASFSSGIVKVYNTSTGKVAYNLFHSDSPVTQIRWRPHTDAVKTKNVLVAINTDGEVLHWHVQSGKLLSVIKVPEEQLFCIDYNADGSRFATAGKSRVIHVFDENSKTLIASLTGGEFHVKPGHSNRVFSIKFHPRDPNVILSAGWDNTVQMWDIREQKALRHLFGPFICGDALDVSNDGKTVLTGSWKVDNQLQLWDYNSCKLLRTIPWRTANNDGDACMVYTAQFSKNPASDVIVAGGSGANEAKVFDLSSGDIASFGTITSMAKGCFTADFSNDSTMLAVAGGDGAIRMLTVQM